MEKDFILKMCDVNKSFPGVRALDSVTFNVERGRINVLIGENGAGKSTLMRILAGASQLDAGEIIINGDAGDHCAAAYRGFWIGVAAAVAIIVILYYLLRQ